MNIAAPTRLRLLALVGVLLVAVGGLGVTTLSRVHGASNTAVTPAALPRPAQHATVPSTKTHATTPSHAKRSHAAKQATTAPAHKATTPAHAATKPAPPVVHRTPKLSSSLPTPLARALATHRVVVVAIGVAGSAVDTEARGEARIGATLAGSGFLAVNAASERDAKMFQTLLKGNLDAPAVLVVKRPGRVFVRLDGFADRQLVAQAAANAG